MKKFLCMLFCILLVFSSAACKGKDVSLTDYDETETRDSLETDSADSDSTDKENENEVDNENVDVDLTVLSGNMLYSQVYNMMMSPEEYLGKTIKMEGMFSHFYDEEKQKHYYACIIQDAMACCSQGIEFIPTEEFSNPEEKYEEGGAVTVSGVLKAYKEDEYDFLTLKNAKLL